jgi:putative salt-induced outer membrane protein
MRRILWLAGVWSVLLPVAYAQADMPQMPRRWKAAAELGYIDVGGNKESTSVNAKLRAEHELPQWRNKFQAEYLQIFEEAGTTAKRSVAQFATNYKLEDNAYLFANLRGENDRLGAYDYRFSETVGYGRRFAWEEQRLDLEAGIGGSQTLYADDERDVDGIVRLAGTYLWEISATAGFSEVAFTEVGEDNAHTESETALRLKIIGRLATKLSYKLLHNSQVPPDREGTDSIAAVTLVYDF